MISVTFEREKNANWPFLLQVDVVGDGSTTTNIKMVMAFFFGIFFPFLVFSYQSFPFFRFFVTPVHF
jgi:hypothetical protein